MKLNLPGVYISQNGKHYLWKPYLKKADRAKYPHIKTDKNGYAKTITIGSTSDPDHKIMATYAQEKTDLFRVTNQYSLDWLYAEYVASRSYRKLSRDTQKRYQGASTRLLNHSGKTSGKPTRLGDYDARHLTTPMIRKILDKRKQAYEAKQPDNPYHGNSELNQELAVLAAMYKYGIQYDNEIAKIGKRPTEGIEKFPIPTRDNCPSAEDYAIAYRVAQETQPAYLPIVMELAKYLASRGIEVTDELTAGDRKRQPDGTYTITLKRRKGSKTTIIECGTELNAAWDAAIALHTVQPIGTTPLLLNSHGDPLTRNAVTKAMQALKAELKNRGLEQHYFQFHDLKRWGITHSQDKGIAGQSLQMQQRYNQEQKVFKQPTDKL